MGTKSHESSQTTAAAAAADAGDGDDDNDAAKWERILFPSAAKTAVVKFRLRIT